MNILIVINKEYQMIKHPAKISKTIINHFKEKMNLKISNKDWFISHYDNLFFQDMNGDKFKCVEKMVVTNRLDLDKHLTFNYNALDKENREVQTKLGVELMLNELIVFKEKIAFLKSKKLSVEINNSISIINNISKNKVKL